MMDHVITDLQMSGYALAKQAIDDTLLDRLRTAVGAGVRRDADEGRTWVSNGNQRVFNLLNYDRVFFDLIEHPAVLGPARRMLGSYATLSSIVANITSPGNRPQAIHTDQQYVAEPWHQCLTFNAVVMLDDFTEENGATRVVPRSHLTGVAPSSADLPTVPITGAAGDVAFIDGRVWHGAGHNQSADKRRRGILVYYCVPYLRQQETFTRSLSRDTIRSLTATQRTLLGFDIWSGLGQVDGLPRQWQGVQTERTGPNDNDGLFGDE